jgi:TPR repeat protein
MELQQSKDMHEAGQFYLAECYYSGNGVTQKYEDALVPPQLEHLVAKYGLGVFYDEDTEVVQSYEEAIKWY